MKRCIIVACLMAFLVCGISLAGTEYKKTITSDTVPTSVIETQNIACALETPYESVGDISKVADIVVLGNVRVTESFVTKNGIIWTKETVDVLENIKGDSIKDTIFVYKMGGQASVDDYVESFDPQIRDMKQNEYSRYDGNELIQQNFSENDLPNVNTPEILFLRNISKFDQKSNAYEPIGDYMGVYVSDTIYEIKATPSNVSSPSNARMSSQEIEDVYDANYEGYFGDFTYEELKRLIR